MKPLIIFIVITLIAINVNAQNSNTHKPTLTPFQGTKEFCEFYQKSKYVVTIKNNVVSIIFIYEQDTSIIHGKIINSKLYTNDADEKADKKFAGKYYLLTKDMIRVLNAENGDYNEYDLCK
jgi:hypothetical protein